MTLEPYLATPGRRGAARWSAGQVVLLVVALIVAVAVRVRHVDSTPTFDELWHLRLSAAKGIPLRMYWPGKVYLDPWRPTAIDDAPPLWRVWTGMDGVLHPPLYVTTLRMWRDVFGAANHVANAYSILWGVAAIGFTFAAARLAMNGAVAFAVAIAMALSTTQVYFSQEIRAYAMLSGLSAICLWLMTRIDVDGPSRRLAVAFAAMTLPLLLTHYFAFGAAVAIGVYGTWRLTGHRRAFFVTLALAALTYAVIWLPFAMQQIDDIGEGDYAWKVPHRNVVRDLEFLANAPYRLIVDRRYAKEPLSLSCAALFVMPWLLVRRLRPLAPWAMTFALSLVTLLALDLIRSTEVIGVTRYLAVAGPAVFLVFAGCGWAIDRRLALVLSASLALMGAVNLYAGIGIDYDVQSFGDVTGELARRARPGDAIAVYGGLQGTFYGDAVLITCSNATDVPRGPYMNVSLHRPITREQQAQLGPRLWLVCSWIEPPPSEIVPGSRVVWQTMLNGNVYLYQLALDNGAVTTRPSSTTAASGERWIDSVPGR